ncbi:MAG: CHRD domain-containing protein, partial [Saprospiraceae bacterium]
MKNVFRILFLLFITVCSTTITAQNIAYNAQLSGQQEVLPVVTEASGQFSINRVGNVLTVDGSFDNLSDNFSAAHIHTGFAGQNGGVLFTLSAVINESMRSGTFLAATNTFTLTSEQMIALDNRNFYINIHSVAQPNGELRGQILPDNDATYMSTLTGSQEAPAVLSSGRGAAILELSGTQLTVSGAFSDLDSNFDTEVGAHIHIGLAGVNGPVAKALNITVGSDNRSGVIDPDLNSFILTPEEIIALQTRALYVNVHSIGQPGGELRGQITPTVTTLFRAHLSGTNENPVVTSLGNGTIIAELDGQTLNLSGAFTDLSEMPTAAHIHIGFAGENGGVLHPLTLTSVSDNTSAILAASNSFTLNPGDISSLLRRGFYINIHTTTHPSGEIRGQLLPLSQSVFNARLSGTMIRPVVETSANGALKAELQGNQLIVTGTLDNLEGPLSTAIQGGVIVHVGSAGSEGAVSFSLQAMLTDDNRNANFEANMNTFTLTDTQLNNLISRRNYVQVYTNRNQMGELRGQFLPDATTYLMAELSGASVMPAVNTTGTGMLILEINAESATASGSFDDLTNNFNGTAQIHNGLAGSNGDPAFFLNATGAGTTTGVFSVDDNTFALTPSLLNELLNRSMYVDLNTAMHVDGEIRGQFLPLTTQYYTAYLAGANEVPTVTTNALGNVKLELAGTQLRVSGSFNGLSSDYNPMIGSHLHIARNGRNGDVAFALTPTLSFDERSATYLVADNVFDLTDAQIAALEDGQFYVNIHSDNQPMGEIRGQVLLEPAQFPTVVDSFLLSEITPFMIEGSPTETFDFEWLAPEDTDELLTYFWELSTEPTFDNIVLTAATDTETITKISLSTLDSLLANLSLDVDDGVDLYQRVMTSNGSLQSSTAARLVRLRRGLVNPPIGFTAQLLGSNEALPIVTRATGSISAVLTNNTLEISGTFDNLTDTVLTSLAGGAHLHVGYAGQNGEVAVPLNITLDNDNLGGSFLIENNTFTLTESQRNAFVNRQMYVNIHSAAFPSGELRGQIIPPNRQIFTTNLFGNNEVPTVMSSGHGAILLDLQDSILTVSGSFADLDGNFTGTPGAHLHFGAAGQNGEVSIPLQVTADANGQGGILDPANNVYTVDGSLVAALMTRNIYANIHTDLHPSGELRGQITEPAIAIFRAHLSGTNEVPAITTSANGQIIAELTTTNELVLSGTYNDLESELATEIGGGHLHVGMAGENGAVLFPLSLGRPDLRSASLSVFNNTFDLTETAINRLIERGLYLNLHTSAHPNGELRGQLLPESQIVFNGILSGIFSLPATNTAAYGQVKAELLGDQLTVSGTYQNLSAALATDLVGGAHIHLGAAGQTGDIEHVLAVNSDEAVAQTGAFSPSVNTFTLTEEQIIQLKTRQNYVNIHSLTEMSGEIRAQLLPEATTYFVAPLGGNSEVPAVRTNAMGMTIVEVNGLNGTLTGSLANLQSDFDFNIAGGAHIHNGLAGSNGGIAFLLNADTLNNNRSAIFAAANNQFNLTQGQLDSLRQRMNYVNIHSVENGGGEIRGQLLPLAKTYFTTSLSGKNEVQPINSDARGSMKFELVDNTLYVSGSFNNLSSRFANEVAEGSHLHLGSAGENGLVSWVLNADPSEDLLSATYSADNNVFILSNEEVQALRDGDYYVNIHSINFPTGELRGQVLLENNFFPTASAMITNPTDGDTLTLAGRPTDQLTINWTAAQDSSQLAYIWQLATANDFASNTILLEQNVANALEITPTFGALDTLLAEAGMVIGDNITLYHRAIASDGSLQTAGSTATVTIIRGAVVPPSGYTALLAGSNEAPPILSMASGRITAQLDGDSLKLAGRFDNLTDTVLTELANGAHLHLGYAGQNGGVIQPLNIDLD